MKERHAIQNQATEWPYTSGKAYADPFNEVEVDVLFTAPGGEPYRVPTFWAGDQEWRVRYAPPVPGTYRYRAICSDESNENLHGQEGVLEVSPYEGDNPLLQHGALQVSQNRRYLEHRDGTPFFWLGDTWWMGLCGRLEWPGDFQLLTADRVAKGFTVIQIVAGLYPDMPAFDQRGANEAGFPWEAQYERVNPGYFDMADLRIQWLVKSGLVPCIVGCWGYFLGWTGVDKMKKHWRNLIARYGAYPVIWCLAGEGTMPYYLSEEKEQDRVFQKKGWTELAAYVRGTDPYHHLITVHPGDSARNQVEDASLLDFDMLQTGHGGDASIPNTVEKVVTAVNQELRMPVVNGEVSYEGIMEGCRQEVQRFMFWCCMLSGAAGFTYGANGIWQVNTRKAPFGPSPHGSAWGDTPWEDAYRLPGSSHLSISKRLLERYDWWRFEPHQEWVEPHGDASDYRLPYAAGIAGEVRVVFVPRSMPITIKGIESEVTYRAFYFDPKDGSELDLGTVKASDTGDWQPSKPPIFQDWILVIERAD